MQRVLLIEETLGRERHDGVWCLCSVESAQAHALVAAEAVGGVFGRPRRHSLFCVRVFVCVCGLPTGPFT